MGYLKDFNEHHLGVRWRYYPREILNPFNWKRVIQFRHQRANKGYAVRDAWNGGEHIAQVAAGILYELGDEQNIIDWDEYFVTNYPDNYGYENLNQVADDLNLYIEWDVIQYQEPLYSQLDTDQRIAMDIQVYSQAQTAMHFVAQNLGHLWW